MLSRNDGLLVSKETTVTKNYSILQLEWYISTCLIDLCMKFLTVEDDGSTSLSLKLTEILSSCDTTKMGQSL